MKTLLYIYGAMTNGETFSHVNVASRETKTVYKGQTYTSFFLCTPSEQTASEHAFGAQAPSNKPHRVSVSFDDSGWTTPTETLRSSLTTTAVTPIGDAFCLLWMVVLWAGWKCFRRKRCKRLGLLLALALATMPLQANIDALAISQSGTALIAHPSLSEISSPNTFLQWSVFLDPECTVEQPIELTDEPDVSFNSVSISGLEPGTYYFRLALRTDDACEGEVASSSTMRKAVYPEAAHVVLARIDQQAGTSVTLTDALPDAIQVYGVMEFDKATLHDESLSVYQRYNYFFSLPFDVRVGDITGFGTYGRHWLLCYYDGAGRAANGYWADSESNWKRIADTDSVLHAGQGYLLQLNSLRMAADQEVWADGITTATLYFPAQNTRSSIAQTYESLAALGANYLCDIDYSDQLGDEGDRTIKDSYWRCIGVPAWMETPQLSGVEFLYEWNRTDNSLSVVSAQDFDFQSMHAYLVQSNSTIEWSSTPASIVARTHNQTDLQEFRLSLHQGADEQDHCYIRFSEAEGISAAYDFNADLVKQLHPGATQLYSFIGAEKVAANCLPFSTDSCIVPIGISASASGEYNLSMSGISGMSEQYNVSLIDYQESTCTLLTDAGPTLTLQAGETNERFALLFAPQSAIPTALEQEQKAVSNAQKILRHGMFYISVDKQLLNAQGIRIL